MKLNEKEDPTPNSITETMMKNKEKFNKICKGNLNKNKIKRLEDKKDKKPIKKNIRKLQP